MRTLRIMGIVGASALLLSTSVAFAEDKSANTRGDNERGDYRAMASSTTARMKAGRDEAQTRMEGQRTKAEEHMKNIQDKAKQEMAQRLAKQFNNLNSTWTDKFMQQLDRYDALVQKIQDRADIAAGNGKDVASTTAAIQSATTAIASARTAVIAQAAAKTYTLDTSTLPTTATTTPSGQEKIMKNFRVSFQTLHKTLFKDLFALRDGPMKDARRAVQDAIQTLGKIPRVDEDNDKND